MYQQSSTPSSARWTRERSTQPVLVVMAEKSALLHPRFAETHRLLLNWLPNAEGFVLPGAAHFLLVEDPRRLAEALTSFFARHPLRPARTRMAY